MWVLGLNLVYITPFTWGRQVDYLSKRSGYRMQMKLPHSLEQEVFPFLLSDQHTLPTAAWILIPGSKRSITMRFPLLSRKPVICYGMLFRKAQSNREGRTCSEGSIFSEKASKAKGIKVEWVLALFHMNLLTVNLESLSLNTSDWKCPP